jgi:hypothetical protein
MHTATQPEQEHHMKPHFSNRNAIFSCQKVGKDPQTASKVKFWHSFSLLMRFFEATGGATTPGGGENRKHAGFLIGDYSSKGERAT